MSLPQEREYTMGKSMVTEENLQVKVPKVTKKALQRKAADDDETIRILVLRALHAAGYDVPETEITDRRKPKG